MSTPDRTALAKSRLGAPTTNGVELTRLVAVGDLSAVYAAASREHGSVAVKLFHPDLAPALESELPALVTRASEMRNAAVPKLLERARFQDSPMLLLELVDGEDSGSLIRRRRGRIPPAEALRITAECLEILGPVHARGGIHGALSPSHVLVAQDGSVHLIGFGEHRLRAACDVPLSSAFVPPELSGRKYAPSVQTDLWALTALLFALLTGRNPRGGPFEEQTAGDTREPRPLGEVAVHAPKPLAQLVDRCLATDASVRIATTEALLAAVRAAAAHPDVQYAHALGSALAPESPHRPVMGASHMTAPPISPLLGSALRAVASSNPPAMRRATEELASAPAARKTPLPPKLGRNDREPQRAPTQDSWLAAAPNVARTPPSGSLVEPVVRVPSVPSPMAATMPAPRKHSPPHGVGRADTHPALPIGELSPPSVRRRKEADLSVGIVTNDEAETAALERCARALARALDARSEPSVDSRPASTDLVRTFEDALTSAPAGLTCRVLPDGLGTAVRTFWTGTGPLARALSTLHQAGVEALALLPGLGDDEIRGLVMLLEHAADPARPATSVVNELHDADFAHVLFHASDMLAGLEPAVRAELEAERRRLLALIGFDASFQLEEAWEKANHGAAAGSPLADDLGALAEGLSPTPSGLAQAFEREREVEPKRAVHVAACSFDDSIFQHSLEAFAPVVRAHVERLAEHDPSLAVTLVGVLVRGVKAKKAELEARKREVANAVLSDRAITRLFTHSGHAATHVDALVELMALLDASHAMALAQAMPEVPDLQLRAKVAHHLELGMTGHEHALGELAGSAGVDAALELVELLGRIDTLAARDALELAATSSHAVVRLAAMGHGDGASSDRLRSELKRLLEQATPTSRILTLRSIADHEVRAAAPFIALRVKSTEFDDLPHEEKRLLLLALARITPSRAEALALELLSQSRLLSGSAHEDSRALAAEALGHIASTEESVQALNDAAKSRWGSSEKVREAAAAALDTLQRRAQAGPRPSRPPRGHGEGGST